MFFDQHGFRVRFEWGIAGVNALAPISNSIAIVDVLSFSTAVDIAAQRGASVYPFRWHDQRAAAFASEQGARLAGSDRSAPGGFTLSPASLLQIPKGMRLVLPSPNGATLSLATGRTPTLAGCLRNAKAVADALYRYGSWVAVIAAGERWPDGSLRPAVEDLLGAGAIEDTQRHTQVPHFVCLRVSSRIVRFVHCATELLQVRSASRHSRDRPAWRIRTPCRHRLRKRCIAR